MKYLLVCLLFLIGVSCNPRVEKSPAVTTEAPQQETDTRVLVRNTFSKMNPLTIPYSFNKEKVAIYLNKLNAEPDPFKKVNLQLQYAYELLLAGNIHESLKQYGEATMFIATNQMAIGPKEKRDLYSTLAIAFMRQGEIENCVQNHNHQSCFLPISGDGVHQLQDGSRKAIQYFEFLLADVPNDLETIYLLNVAYMTLGEYPDKVPEQWRIDPSLFSNKVKMTPLKDIAPALGVNENNLAGGVVMDDFNNDGWPDIVTTAWHYNTPAKFYLNNGDGTFTDQTEAVGLGGQMGCLNLNQTDFNNDGWLDLYLMRGAWYGDNGDIPNTLMMNNGDGTFVDVTISAGLTKFSPTQTSAWADFNLDGWLDLIVANESFPDLLKGLDLYINQQDGTFAHQSNEYGLTQNEFFKGCVASDVNNDGYPDIYLSNLSGETLLLINQGAKGESKFIPAQGANNPKGPTKSFPCWSFDYDNDGNEDLFVSAFSNEDSPGTMWMKCHTGNFDRNFLPKLNHNKGGGVFEEVGQNMGLNEVAFTMGCNFGDINSDGFLDFYLTTGNPLYQSLVPNKMYLNMEGKKFEDVTYSCAVGNVQKGHGVSFGDIDRDGDEDIYVVIGGAYDGDGFYNCLFENPNQDKNNWVVLKLEGQTANKAAVGARVAISVQEKGKERMIYRTVTSGASFGANSLNLEVGLRKAQKINHVTVQWPCKDCVEQQFTGINLKKAYVLTQNQSEAKLMEYSAVKMGKEGMHHDISH